MVSKLNNATAFEFGRMDAAFIDKLFCIHYRVGFQTSPTASTEPSLQGSLSGFVGSINVDGCVFGLNMMANGADINFEQFGSAGWDSINLTYLQNRHGSTEGSRIWNAIGQRRSNWADDHQNKIYGKNNRVRFGNFVTTWSRFGGISVKCYSKNIHFDRVAGRLWNQSQSSTPEIQSNSDYTGTYGIVNNQGSANYIWENNITSNPESPKGPLILGTVYYPLMNHVDDGAASNDPNKNRQYTINGTTGKTTAMQPT